MCDNARFTCSGTVFMLKIFYDIILHCCVTSRCHNIAHCLYMKKSSIAVGLTLNDKRKGGTCSHVVSPAAVDTPVCCYLAKSYEAT